jgi:hypothetical protein
VARFAREHECGLCSWSITDKNGDTYELVFWEPEFVDPEAEPKDEELLPSDTRPEPVITSDPPEVVG